MINPWNMIHRFTQAFLTQMVRASRPHLSPFRSSRASGAPQRHAEYRSQATSSLIAPTPYTPLPAHPLPVRPAASPSAHTPALTVSVDAPVGPAPLHGGHQRGKVHDARLRVAVGDSAVLAVSSSALRHVDAARLGRVDGQARGAGYPGGAWDDVAGVAGLQAVGQAGACGGARRVYSTQRLRVVSWRIGC